MANRQEHGDLGSEGGTRQLEIVIPKWNSECSLCRLIAQVDRLRLAFLGGRPNAVGDMGTLDPSRSPALWGRAS